MNELVSSYYQTEKISSAISNGKHRELVGGLWEQIGRLQFDLLVADGLRPEHTLVDVGCGALRGGVHFVRYLDPKRYYGLDLSRELLDVGYDKELMALKLADRLPREHLIADRNFDFPRFGTTFDRAIAFSLFTHLTLDLIGACLERLAEVMRPGGILYATFFEAQEPQSTFEDIRHEPGGITTHWGRDPYHQRVSDFERLAKKLPWDMRYIGDFDHPRSQKLITFTRRTNTVENLSQEKVRGPTGG